jgi:hypothetical protein
VRDYSLRGESGSTRLHPEFDREFQKYFDHAGAVNNYPLAYSISGDTARAKAAYNFESAPALFSLFAENLVAGPRCSTRDGHWGLPPGPRPLWNPSPIYTSLSIDGRLTDGEDEQDEQSEMTIFCAPGLRADKYCPALLSICRAVRPFCREPPLGGRFLSTQRKKRSPPIWRANGV